MANAFPIPAPMKFTLRQITLDAGGYDNMGGYWGRGNRLYRYETDDGDVSDHVRALHRDDAKALIRRRYPNAVFYR